MERMIFMSKFKNVDEIHMRIMSFQFKICNVGEIDNKFHWRK